jgi:hypothetical protein
MRHNTVAKCEHRLAELVSTANRLREARSRVTPERVVKRAL